MTSEFALAQEDSVEIRTRWRSDSVASDVQLFCCLFSKRNLLQEEKMQMKELKRYFFTVSGFYAQWTR